MGQKCLRVRELLWQPLYLQGLSSLLVVDASEGSNGGRQATGQQFGGLSVVFWFGPEQCDDVLQVAGGLQAQSIHHVAQVVDICGQLFSGMGAQLGNEQDDIAVRLHGRPSDGAQPVVGCVI